MGQEQRRIGGVKAVKKPRAALSGPREAGIGEQVCLLGIRAFPLWHDLVPIRIRHEVGLAQSPLRRIDKG